MMKNKDTQEKIGKSEMRIHRKERRKKERTKKERKEGEGRRTEAVTGKRKE